MDTSNVLAGICFFLLSLNGFISSNLAMGFCPTRCDCQHSHLGGNFISNISAFDFTRYSNLERLNLQYNQIRIIHPKAFEKLSTLEELYLGHNLLTAIPAGSLQPLNKLTILYGNNNAIKKITPELFSNLDNLIKLVLKLKNNFLTSLSGDMFALNNALYNLDLQGNNWTCDCRLEDLRKWIAAAHSQGKLLTVFVQCHYPATLRGKYLDYVNSSQLQPLGNWTHLCRISMESYFLLSLLSPQVLLQLNHRYEGLLPTNPWCRGLLCHSKWTCNHGAFPAA
uniref:TLR4 interactor with leucine rich repeats n=1 Tax=Amphilophus citrinellus TaxID=61819 RepID=A0A3Q0QZX5_AMPCI